jgi:hypothetical protein
MSTARTPLFLMANLGVEVERLVRAKKEHADTSDVIKRATRIALSLIEHPDMQNRKIETEHLLDSLNQLNGEASSSFEENFTSYFTPFTLRFGRLALGQ